MFKSSLLFTWTPTALIFSNISSYTCNRGLKRLRRKSPPVKNRGLLKAIVKGKLCTCKIHNWKTYIVNLGIVHSLFYATVIDDQYLHFELQTDRLVFKRIEVAFDISCQVCLQLAQKKSWWSDPINYLISCNKKLPLKGH